MPLRLTVCGLSGALSVMLTEAVRLPLADGVNVTLIVQLPPAATELPQVSVSEKSLAFMPVTVMLVMLRAPLPVLFSVDGLSRTRRAHRLAGEGQARG